MGNLGFSFPCCVDNVFLIPFSGRDFSYYFLLKVGIVLYMFVNLHDQKEFYFVFVSCGNFHF